jgi:hypothetical protein
VGTDEELLYTWVNVDEDATNVEDVFDIVDFLAVDDIVLLDLFVVLLDLFVVLLDFWLEVFELVCCLLDVFTKLWIVLEDWTAPLQRPYAA